MHGACSRWRSSLWFWLLAAACLVLPATEATADDASAQRQLDRARFAAEHLDYTGTLIQQQGPEMQTTRISYKASNKPDNQGGMERVEWLDGPAREYRRQGADIVWFLPRERRIIHDRRSGVDSFPALSFRSAAELLNHYRAGALARDRVAGRTAEVMRLLPLDELRYGYRFWFDASTGLLLRAQSINESGQVVRQTGFSQLSLGLQSAPRARMPVYDTRSWRVDKAVSGTADLSGWSFHLPAGFRQVSALRRVLGRGQSGTGEPREVVQVVFSDGLAGISVFIEPWSAARSAHPVQLGAVNMVGKRSGKFWLTIVGEVPMAAIRKVADTLEFSAPAIK